MPMNTAFVNAAAHCRPVPRTATSIGLFFLLAWGCAGIARANPDVVLGDYDAEPRTGSHVDTDRLVRRLHDLGANTYMWLIFHNTNDWEDLKVFSPRREGRYHRLGLSRAHSETTVQEQHWPYSEPFRPGLHPLGGRDRQVVDPSPEPKGIRDR